MAIASRQILAGIHDPSELEGNNTLEMISKKVDALLKDKGAEGWGLHAVQGWSLWKVILWMGAFTLLGLLFVILWLVLVDPKDLQNAFTPGAFLVAMLCLVNSWMLLRLHPPDWGLFIREFSVWCHYENVRHCLEGKYG